MGLFDFFKKSEPVKQKKSKRYYGANTNNLFSSWNVAPQTADQIIKKDLKVLRERARNLHRDNSIVNKYVNLLLLNVVGKKGFNFQNKSQDANGTLDSLANSQIENAWKLWSKECDVKGKLTLKEILETIVKTVAIDGEIIIRVVSNFPNNYGFALQLIEADYLDEQFNDINRRIKMGIEYDKWERPIAYHIFSSHPADYENQNRKRIRVSADEIYHLYRPDRPSQTRGVTWLHSVMTSLQMYDGFAEASLVEKRLTASKMGFYLQPQGEEYTGDDSDDAGNPINEATPAQFEILPHGWDFKEFDPKSGNDDFPTFGKAIIRNIASGLNVSYNSLANDLEGVNYSSIRAGLLDERDYYASLQEWLINTFLNPLFSQWLEMQLLRQTIKLPLSKLEKFNSPLFIGRGWNWVDPSKDINASIEAINNGLSTSTQILSEKGLDIEEVYQQLANEKKLQEKYGLDFNPVQNGVINNGN